MSNFAKVDAEIKSRIIAGCKSNWTGEKGLTNLNMTLQELL